MVIGGPLHNAIYVYCVRVQPTAREKVVYRIDFLLFNYYYLYIVFSVSAVLCTQQTLARDLYIEFTVLCCRLASCATGAIRSVNLDGRLWRCTFLPAHRTHNDRGDGCKKRIETNLYNNYTWLAPQVWREGRTIFSPIIGVAFSQVEHFKTKIINGARR